MSNDRVTTNFRRERTRALGSASPYVLPDGRRPSMLIKAGAILAALAIAATLYSSSQPDIPVPDLPATFWGPEKQRNASPEIRRFKIDVPKSVTDDLKQRLEKTRSLTEPLENSAWTYGISSAYLKTILDYWTNKYDWNERQALLNKYPQFVTNIQGLDIHFYHVKPSNLPKNRNLKVYPLLLVHGWPGSVVEFQKIIPMLTTPQKDRDFVFEVIAPSLPGYGFSDAAVRPGLGSTQVAVILKNLMTRLGIKKFYAQGGDWGSLITSNIAVLYPESVLGVHVNMCFIATPSSFFWQLVGVYFPSLVVSEEHRSKMYPMSFHLSRLLEETGYLHIQATKPDTIGVGLSDSPAGLAAYILEKFSTWTNPEYRSRPDGGLLEKFTLDELLDNVMVYWVTNSITTSTRLYAEHFNKANMAMKVDQIPVKVPVGHASFPHELVYTPESFTRTRYPHLIQFNHMPRGGHFAAFEEPALLAADVFSFVEKREELSKQEEKAKVAEKKSKSEDKNTLNK